MAGRITAVLGPTNTGKTHYAIERMLAHRTGVIGLPLRLLAREVYDRIVKARGPSVVALITGEERIVPERAAYWVATTEAMPEVLADFVAIDEIQLCADPERGHVFTDRLLHMRGLHETLFLGSSTMRPAIAALVPEAQFMRRERFSTLSWAGSKKLSRMPARSAIVGFSVDDVYATAELLRRLKGGCAVVMGALSPRTRNAQVAMYQAGEVDYLVATDAIGMGLNLDIRHVAFQATHKFDGRRMRPLFPHELGQIAGRAGRHTEAGTFGVTGEAQPLDEGLIDAIENHRFQPISRLVWRNAALEFGTVDRLVQSLEQPSGSEWLGRGREADDLHALKALRDLPEIRDRVTHPKDVRLLWDVCRIPDFRGISPNEHLTLLARIFGFLQDGGIPGDWLARAVGRIDRTGGDIDAISKRLAYIRTWTYVAQRAGWVRDEAHWRGETRAVEDRLSDALHAALTQRFVDRRTSVLMRRLKQKESLVAEVNDKGEVTVEGEFAGRLDGFRFRADPAAQGDEARMLTRAAYEALRPEFHLRADRFYNAPDTELDFTEQGGLMWGATAVGKLVKGPEPLKPGIEVFVDEDAGEEVAEKVRRRLQHFIDRKIAAGFEPLLAMQADEALTGLARGVAFRLVEAMGVLPREGVAADIKALDQEARGLLRKHGVRFGQYTIFLPAVLKPAPTRLRLLLSALAEGLDEFPESPPPGLVTIPNIADVPRGYYTLSGYHPAGERAIRIDMLERLADMLRGQDSRAGFEATPEMLSITGMTLEQFADLMGGLGYRAEKAERPKARGTAAAAGAGEAIADAAAGAEPAPRPDGASAAPMTEEETVLAAETRARWDAEQAERARQQAAAEARTGQDATAEARTAPDAAPANTGVGPAEGTGASADMAGAETERPAAAAAGVTDPAASGADVTGASAVDHAAAVDVGSQAGDDAAPGASTFAADTAPAAGTNLDPDGRGDAGTGEATAAHPSDGGDMAATGAAGRDTASPLADPAAGKAETEGAAASAAQADPADAARDPAAAEASDAPPSDAGAAGSGVAAELESYYTFTWAPRPRGPRRGAEGDARGARRGPRRFEGGAGAETQPGAATPEGAEPRGGRGPRGDRRFGGKSGGGDRPRDAEGAGQHGSPQGGRPEGGRGDQPRGDGKPGRFGKGSERGGDRGGDRGGKPGGKPRNGNGPGGNAQGERRFEARPPRSEKPIDPDSPFAVLAALKTKS